jgi:hypothetical protein
MRLFVSTLIMAALVVPASAAKVQKQQSSEIVPVETGITAGMADMRSDHAVVMNNMAMKNRTASDNAAGFYVAAFDKYVAEPAGIYKLRLWLDWPGTITAQQKNELSRWVKANDAALSSLVQGSSKSYFWLLYPEKTPLGMGPLASYRQVSSLATALCWRAKLEAADGDYAAAVRDILAAYRFGAHIADPPHRIWEQKAGYDIETDAMWTAGMALAKSNIDIASITELQKQLQSSINDQKFMYNTLGDRVVVIEAIDRTFDDTGKVYPAAVENFKRDMGLTESDAARWLQLDMQSTMSLSHRLFVWVSLNMRRSPGEMKMAQIDLAKEIDDRTAGNVLLEHFRPDILKTYDIPFRASAESEAIVTICGIKRYMAEHQGQVPPTLKVLQVTGFIEREPADPYRDGYSLTYIPTDTNFKLYSYGADYRNSFAQPSKWGQGPSGGDQVFWPLE